MSPSSAEERGGCDCSFELNFGLDVILSSSLDRISPSSLGALWIFQKASAFSHREREGEHSYTVVW